MRAFAVDHAGHPALAYIIGSRIMSGLKAEYQHLNMDEIRHLVKSGTSIKADPIEKIEIAYTGDTCAYGLIKQQSPPTSIVVNAPERAKGFASSSSDRDIGQLFRAELLLCELTFLDSSEGVEQQCRAIERGHIHINDIERIFSSHISTWWDEEVVPSDITDASSIKKTIVFYHLSSKYQPGMRALDFIIEGLPSQLLRYYDCYVAIFSMLEDSMKVLPRNGCICLERYRRWRTK